MAKKSSASKSNKNSKSGGSNSVKRTRTARPYPASSFADALQLGKAIMEFAAGQKVRRLTLLEKMSKTPSSSATKMMITNSGKYGITTGSYSAEYLELTEDGKKVVDPIVDQRERRLAKFNLAIEGVPPFKLLYDHYKGRRLPEREVIKDVLEDSDIEVPDADECVDTFTVNVQELELLRVIGGAETLISIEQVAEEMPTSDHITALDRGSDSNSLILHSAETSSSQALRDWENTCFYITPIGDEESEQRKHADLFMAHIIEPALAELWSHSIPCRPYRCAGNDNIASVRIFEEIQVGYC